jgi:hypothetical protein
MSLSPGRLERLLRVRKAGERREHGRWAQANRALEAKRSEERSAVAARDAATDDLRRRALGSLDVARLQAADAARESKRRDVELAGSASLEAGRRAEEGRRALERAHRAVRILEKLAEKGAAESRERLRRIEAREQDDRPRAAEAP